MQVPYSRQHQRPSGSVLLAKEQQITPRPLISVVMTCYNCLPWIDSAIDSILKQTWSNLELLIVDDCSTDGSREHLAKHVSRDSRIRLLWMMRNSGTYAAKNIGIRAARGEIITFMDSDDTSLPDRLAMQLQPLRATDIVATTCNYERRTAQGELVLNRGLPARQALISLMFKRSVVDDIGWFDWVRYAADDEFFERLRVVYGRPAHINISQTLYLALLRDGSLSNDRSKNDRIDLAADSLPPIRTLYKKSSAAWHESLIASDLRPYMPYDKEERHPFWDAAKETSIQ